MSWPKAGSHAMHPGCSRPTEGVLIDWWAPPSGASVTPDGVPTRIDCPPRIDPERPGLQRPIHEGVVQSPDRKEWLTVPCPGQPELPEKTDEVTLGVPNSMC